MSLQNKQIGRRTISCAISLAQATQLLRCAQNKPTLLPCPGCASADNACPTANLVQIYCVNEYNSLRWNCQTGEVRTPAQCRSAHTALSCFDPSPRTAFGLSERFLLSHRRIKVRTISCVPAPQLFHPSDPRTDDEHNFLCVPLRDAQATVVQSLHYKPTCMTANMGYVAVGSQRGELNVVDHNGAQLFNQLIGSHATNGAAAGECGYVQFCGSYLSSLIFMLVSASRQQLSA